jgi:hypothetical protein
MKKPEHNTHKTGLISNFPTEGQKEQDAHRLRVALYIIANQLRSGSPGQLIKVPMPVQHRNGLANFAFQAAMGWSPNDRLDTLVKENPKL